MKGGIDSVAGKVDASDHLRSVFGERLCRTGVDLERQTSIILNSAGDPEARVNLVAKASAKAVALVLGIGEMAAERGGAASAADTGFAYAQEKASSNREPGVAYYVGFAEEAGEALQCGSSSLASMP